MTDRRDFLARKKEGTAAELALVGLLTAHGATVIHHQGLHDMADGVGPALARTRDGGMLHLPDLSVIWPGHALQSFGVEVKLKRASTADEGSWLWDMEAFTRALAWAQQAGQPVLYAVRDPDLAPLPAPGALDNPAHWRVASVTKLLISRQRSISKGFNIWPDNVFSPLSALLVPTQLGVMQLPHFRHADGHPPRLF